jgi:diguanylate cyclase (GGDEF)-like protein/putative nucleotidyltransferase with HDIG domain
MKWEKLPFACRAYLLLIYAAAIPVAFLCFYSNGSYTWSWLFLTIASLFIAVIHLNLPELPAVVISMGDVFTFLALVEFGAGPALITYWANVIGTAFAQQVGHKGWRSIGSVTWYRLAFNVSSCALSIYGMETVYRWSANTLQPEHAVIGLALVASIWFLINTLTLSVAVSLSSSQSFFAVWKQGLGLYLLNFFGSAGAAGLISRFYERTSFSIFLLSLPIAVVVFQLYNFYIQKYQQAKKHISELNTLYLQTIEALASAVDAKDRYTHGHIRRVQAYAVELAGMIGIEDEKELLALEAGALLHDIGKIAIPEYILNKPTVLTETEYEKMRIHPVVGATMLSTIEFPFPLIPMVKSHHERWDGKGYPDGLAGEEIPLNARILSLVDCYDALTTNRPYRAPMDRDKVIEFFRREAGRAYDPAIVQTFVKNIKQLEKAGSAVVVEKLDLWGIKESDPPSGGVRPLEKIQPILSYSKALNAEALVQRELYSVFEFAQADFHCLSPTEIFSFMGWRLSNLIKFDTAVFFDADLSKGVVIAAHSIGDKVQFFEGLSLPLEQKLTGWVAANNQSLCNLPPFPDFLNLAEPKPAFQISAIAPINRQNEVLGAISLYRNEAVKFTEQDFRRLEIVASQTAMVLAKCKETTSRGDSLTDELTGLPKSFQLYLMFDSVAVDANRYEYPLALLSIQLEDIANIRKKWGHLSGDQAIKATANYLRKELRETDLLVRYAADEFVAVNPKMSRAQAENLKSRVQNELDQFNFAVRAHTEIKLSASIGIAVFPEDGTDLESLLRVSGLCARDDRDLRLAVNRRIKRLPASS